MHDPRINKKEFALRFKAALRAKQWTVADLLTECMREGIDLSPGTPYFWARAQHTPSKYETAARIANLLEVSPQWLCYGEQQ